MQTSAQTLLFVEPKATWLIGLDETGTGAWSGPIFVGGVIAPVDWKVEGVGDSKALTDEKRRELVPKIEASLKEVGGSYLNWEVPVGDIDRIGQKPCWRRALHTVIRLLEDRVPEGEFYRIVVDGSVDRRLARDLARDDRQRPLGVDFQRKADRDIQHVGAASILAKTARNDVMLRLHEEHPQYGWDRNTGYPTPEHAAMVLKHGRTLHHRMIDTKALEAKAAKAEVESSGADISSDGLYRYRLWRRWGPGKMVLFVMLNPSTADASDDDPTIRKCIGFAKRWGYAGIEVVNLYALRSTDPSVLLHKDCPDPIGPRNNDVIFRALRTAGLVVAAWGVHGPKPVQGGAVTGRVEYVRKLMRGASANPKCLGLTKSNAQPRHPLMLAYKTPLELLEKEEGDGEDGLA